MNAPSPFHRAASLASVAMFAALVAALASCGGPVSLTADPGYETELEGFLGAHPFPLPWRVAEAGETPVAALHLGLEAPSETAVGSGTEALGRRWLAPSLDITDPRLSLTPAEAESARFLDIDRITLPSRAVTVGGLWPGEEGYPFGRDLVARISGTAGKPAPAGLKRWLSRAADDAAQRVKSDGAGARPFVLAATGDIQVSADMHPALGKGEAGLLELLGGALPRLRAADILVGNLEAPISERGEPSPLKRYLFRMPPVAARALAGAGFDLLLFANNHVFDFGPAAFTDTLSTLEAAELPFVGAGPDLARAAAPHILDAPDGSRLAFIGFAAYPDERYGWVTANGAAGPDRPGHNADEAATLAAIRSALAAGSVPIVLAHGGSEYRFEPAEDVLLRYRAFAEAGAAAVIGSHPHVLQGVSAAGTSLIAWSLGNFLFTDEDEPAIARDSAILELLMSGGLVRGFRLVSVRVEPSGTDSSATVAAVESAFMERTRSLAVP